MSRKTKSSSSRKQPKSGLTKTTITTKEIVNVPEVKAGRISFWEILKRTGAILGVFGGLFGLFLSYNSLANLFGVQSELSGRIVSYAVGASYNIPNNEMDEDDLPFTSLQIFNKIAINVINEDFVYDKVIPTIEFQDGTVVEGMMMNPLKFTLTLDSVVTMLNAPVDEMMIYNSVLYKNKNNVLYVTYYVKDDNRKYLQLNAQDGFLEAKENYKFPKSIQFKFRSVENGNYFLTDKMTISKEEVWTILFDHDIWKPVGKVSDFRKTFFNSENSSQYPN